MGGKRGQMNLSFGMIFSIILIIIFLVFAFYAINTFFGIQKSAQVGMFLDDFRSDVNMMWRSQGSQEREYRLPKKIEMICFIDRESSSKGPIENKEIFDELEFFVLDNDNMVFYPKDSASPASVEIRNINLEDITENENPFCIKNERGTLRLTLVKNFDEAEVRIKRSE